MINLAYCSDKKLFDLLWNYIKEQISTNKAFISFFELDYISGFEVNILVYKIFRVFDLRTVFE